MRYALVPLALFFVALLGCSEPACPPTDAGPVADPCAYCGTAPRCRLFKCDTGECHVWPRPDGTPCPGGTCTDGACVP